MIGKGYYFKVEDPDPDLGLYFIIANEHGMMDDHHIAHKFPDFAAAEFYEEMESTFSTPLSASATRQWLLDHGFTELK